MSYFEYDESEHYEEPQITENDYEHAKDHLYGLVNAFYQTGSVDDLERHLEEVLHVFDMKLPKGKPAIVRKPSNKEVSTDRMLKHWVGYTRAYAEMMTKNNTKVV